MKGIVDVINCPAKVRRFIIAQAIDGKLWFWGSWDNETDALKESRYVASGVVIDCQAV